MVKKTKGVGMLLNGEKLTDSHDLRVVVIGSPSSFSEDGFMPEVIEKVVSGFGIKKPTFITSTDLHNKLKIMDPNDYADIFFVEYDLDGILSKGPHIVEALKDKYECSYFVGWSGVTEKIKEEFVGAGANQVMSKRDFQNMRNLDDVFTRAHLNYLEKCPETETESVPVA